VPTYDSIISRTDADVLIPTDDADAVIAAATQESVALTLFNRAQLSTKVTRQPVMSALPVAYWVSGDTGLKQTTEAAWAGVDLTAEEIACIVPIPENVVDDSSFDVWGELRPARAEAVAQVLDAAAIGGINKPASWPAAIIPAAISAGNAVELGTATGPQGGVVGDLESAFDQVEADGFSVSGIATVTALKGSCGRRGTRPARSSRTCRRTASRASGSSTCSRPRSRRRRAPSSATTRSRSAASART
jgi:HK97 family phage major capsid protein